LLPNDPELYNNRGNAKSLSGDTDGAFQDYNRAIELSPKDSRAYFNRAVTKV
jgi:Flp pilus assembly protein TadD